MRILDVLRGLTGCIKSVFVGQDLQLMALEWRQVVRRSLAIPTTRTERGVDSASSIVRMVLWK
jgi:hypothetical protein